LALTVLAALVASIPSPPDNAISIGPLELRAYGLAIAVGVLVAVEVARRRWVAQGGSPEAIGEVAIWAVPAGFVGARLYHVITDWNRFEDAPLDAFKVWEGGLGIPGAVFLGTVVGVVVARRKGYDVPRLMYAAAPALPLAQAIGRLGNWFNQELFGRPTDLPWGLEIDPEHRPRGYEDVETFHPTFLYEALWNLALAAGLIWLGRRRVLRPGQLFVLYVGGYALGRLWVEALRIDSATRLAGVRVNIWVSGLTLLAAAAVFVWRQRGGRPEETPELEPEPEPEPAGDTEIRELP
jgi:prolipoprotein diacylglyceryl transferase